MADCPVQLEQAFKQILPDLLSLPGQFREDRASSPSIGPTFSQAAHPLIVRLEHIISAQEIMLIRAI